MFNMLIGEYVTKIQNTDATTSTLKPYRESVCQACSLYLTAQRLYSTSEDDNEELYNQRKQACEPPSIIYHKNDNDMVYYYILTTNKFREITRGYRKDILKVSESYKKKGILAQTFDGIDLMDCIASEFRWNFHSRSYDKRKMISYTPSKFRTACMIAFAFLFSRYNNVYDFQAYATMIYVLMEYFDFRTVNRDICKEIDIIMTMDIALVQKYQTKYIGQRSIKPRKKKVVEKKAKLPSYDEFKLYLDSGKYTHAELEKIIADQYNVSTRTVRRHIAGLGLAREYKITK